jgi:hypothetical protein
VTTCVNSRSHHQAQFYFVYKKFYTDQPSNCSNIRPFPFTVNSVMLCEQRLSEQPPGGSPLDESIPSQHIQNKIHTYQNVSTVLTVSLVCLYTHIPVIPNLEYHNHIHVWHPSLPSYKCFLCMCSIWGYCYNFIPSKCESFIRIFHFALVIFLMKYGSYYLRHLWPSKQTNRNKMANCESAAFCGGELT